jgi:hypothetical protein
MEEDPFKYLPDEAFYVILTTSSLEHAADFEPVYGKKNPELFKNAARYFAKELHLPLLTLTQMVKIYYAKDVNKSAELSIMYGDFPDYIASLIPKLKSKDMNVFMEYAMSLHREDSAIVLFQTFEHKTDRISLMFRGKAYFLQRAILYRCRKCLFYVYNEDLFENYLHGGYLSGEPFFRKDLKIKDGIEWALNETGYQITRGIIIDYLVADRYEKDLFLVLIEHSSKKEIEKAYREHLHSLKTGKSFGRDYLLDLKQEQKAEITKIFRSFL